MKVHHDKETNIITITEIPYKYHYMDIGISCNVWCKLIDNGLEIHLNTIQNSDEK